MVISFQITRSAKLRLAHSRVGEQQNCSPLIEPDVRISRIRLSDWFHAQAHGRTPSCTVRSRRTPNFPKIVSASKRRVPRVDTL